MSYNAINSQTIRAQQRKEARRQKLRFSLPRHIDPGDHSSDADRKRYDLHTAMMRMNPNGWRKVGKRGASSNRFIGLALNAYGLEEQAGTPVEQAGTPVERWGDDMKGAVRTIKEMLNIQKELHQ